MRDPNAIVLRQEAQEAYTALRDSFYRRFQPADLIETHLVDRMVAAAWRLRRLAALESAAIDHAMDAQRSELDATYKTLDPETRAHLAFDKLHKDSTSMANYQRYQSSQVRFYDRAFRSLQDLRKQKM